MRRCSTPWVSPLNTSTGRASCYACHPGDTTQCLRGAMGKSIGPDGDFAMDCQSCHGTMTDVSSIHREGWFDEPNCQACHPGSATQNPGQIRYTNAFDALGNLRQPTTNLFATEPNTPAQGLDLYRFSTGHGGLQCSACHGPPHAIYPTSEANDNQQSIQVQGHAGTVQDCSACHSNLSDTEKVMGPHGMHPSNARWVNDDHGDYVEDFGYQSCKACHGGNLRGTVLSEAKTTRTIQTQFGTKNLYRGFQIGCYNCHDGPDDDDPYNNRAPVVQGANVQTPNDVPLVVPFVGSVLDGDPLTYRAIEQPTTGTVGWTAQVVTYYPREGFVGTDSFAIAAWDGDTQSARAIVSVQVGPASCSGSVETFGFGCPSSNGEVPRLRSEDCPTPGNAFSLDLDRCPPLAPVLLLQGIDSDQRELWLGCILRVRSPFDVTLLRVDANGAVQYDVNLPVGWQSNNCGVNSHSVSMFR